MDKAAQRLERVKLSQRRLLEGKRETELKTLYTEIETISQIVTHIDAITNNHSVPSLWLHEGESSKKCH